MFSYIFKNIPKKAKLLNMNISIKTSFSLYNCKLRLNTEKVLG